MSVFTPVTPGQMSAWLKYYSIGTLTQFDGIAAGIENTNYFVTTTHGRYVLTLFEKLKARELPFYLDLMAHLARHGILCPRPIANLDNGYLGELNGKPAAIVTRVPGTDLKQVDARQCAVIGAMLAEMHLAGASYRAEMPNPRGPGWWQAALPEVLPFLDQRAAALLREEVRFQSRHRRDGLPRGVIHADLFRDNVLWDDGRVCGIIDFYFACTDALLYDVAIAVNDWCVTADGAPASSAQGSRLRDANVRESGAAPSNAGVASVSGVASPKGAPASPSDGAPASSEQGSRLRDANVRESGAAPSNAGVASVSGVASPKGAPASPSDGALDRDRTAALLAAYHKTRPFTAAERDAWPAMLRAGALRFWVSRLYDLHLPRPGVLTHAKDPTRLQRLLEHHVTHAAGTWQLSAP